MFEFPRLTGRYKIGSTQRYIKDESRQEIYNKDNPAQKRELMTSVWYPAHTHAYLEIYNELNLEQTKQEWRDKGCSEEDIALFDQVFCHASPNAQLLKPHNQYPVIIFSHGYGDCSPSIYTAFCEELASHGYVVISISHTYYASKTTFPDGRIIKASTEIMSRWPNADDIKIWVGDVDCVLNEIKQWNTDPADQFFGLLDLNKIGMFGHSYGGAVSFEMCAFDDRIKTGISLDAALYGKATLNNMNKPFMFIMAEASVTQALMTDEEVAQKHSMSLEVIKSIREKTKASDNFMKFDLPTLNNSTNPSSFIIPNLEHGAFSDFSLMKETPFFKKHKDKIPFEKIVGAVDGVATIKLINQYIVEFFKENLK